MFCSIRRKALHFIRWLNTAQQINSSQEIAIEIFYWIRRRICTELFYRWWKTKWIIRIKILLKYLAQIEAEFRTWLYNFRSQDKWTIYTRIFLNISINAKLSFEVDYIFDDEIKNVWFQVYFYWNVSLNSK